MFDILVSSLKHNNRFLHLRRIVQKFTVEIVPNEVSRNQVFYSIELNRAKSTPHHSKLENVFNFYTKVKMKLKCMTQKKKKVIF